MPATYRNPWIPPRVLDELAAEPGPILDVGGGCAPYYRAAHVLDVLPFDFQGMINANSWGGERKGPWRPSEYTQFDICAGRPWPFADGAFALGLCSHTLEDLRDPLPPLAEMGRVCRRLLIVTPSRLAEQTRGMSHPRFAGFAHHPWAVTRDAGGLVFRRKTALAEFPGCYLTLPPGKTYTVDAGTFVYSGPPVAGREHFVHDSASELADYREFLAPFRPKFRDLLRPDFRPWTFRRRVYHWRQKYLGVP